MKKNKQLSIGIFGFGNFGTLAASILRSAWPGADIRIYHYKKRPADAYRAKKINVRLTDLKTAANSQIVILATPISKTEKAIKAIAPFVAPGALVVDTCSVKVLPCQWLKKHLPKNIEIIGTHPMFGPDSANYDFEKQTWSLAGLQIILCPLRIKTAKLEVVKKFLSGLGLKMITTTPENHDRQNAVTLSLVHFLGRTLRQAGIREQAIFTPGYAVLLKMCQHTINDSWQLFYDMNNYNPYAKQARKKFLKAAVRIEAGIIKAGQKHK